MYVNVMKILMNVCNYFYQNWSFKLMYYTFCDTFMPGNLLRPFILQNWPFDMQHSNELFRGGITNENSLETMCRPISSTD